MYEGAMGSAPMVARGLQVVQWPKIWRAVKVLGVAAVAGALQMEVGELATHLLQHPPRRRKRGITARQLSSARRVNRIVCNWHKQLTASPKRSRC